MEREILFRGKRKDITGSPDVDITVEACDNSTIKACDNSIVEACDNSTVKAYGNSIVEAYGNSIVEACDNSTVQLYTVTAKAESISSNSVIIDRTVSPPKVYIGVTK
jgi:hypothetical protein